MTEPLQPDDVVAAIRAAPDDTAALEVERRFVTDTAEEDPGEVDGGHSSPDAPGGGAG